MKISTKILLPLLTCGLYSSGALADRYCVQNVDNLQLFYVNGMFTKHSNFTSNLAALNRFQDNYLYMFRKAGNVVGQHNFSESLANQIYEVGLHKLQDMEENAPIRQLLTLFVAGELNKASRNTLGFLNQFMELVMEENVWGIIYETDYRNMRVKLDGVLSQCNRTILVTHSQGNFYGNKLYSETFGSYQYYHGPMLSEYPMLGYIGIANPSYEIGGPLGLQNPSIAKTFTNQNDLVMKAVRYAFGAIPANPISGSSAVDFTAHSLQHSYLESPTVRDIIAEMMESIANELKPYPMFEQNPSSSSAIKSIGYSKISNILDVKFKHGGVYRYFDVPVGTWENFYKSTSHGRYFNTHIRDNFSYEKIIP
ncbi:KTSC domain-containing protein [uncultured Vibrio sp.]|uniref:KTSC domain-containing protein n=1 Tax=uncultured Vibrio sp. TaxID=114054 RepID=UPI0029C7E991|nr:KTSC domain-containing protein [uncultured Vibrio sp.]